MKKLLCQIVKYIVDILNEVLTWCHTTINAPTLLTATLVPPNIDLAWVDNSDNETCFTVWRSTDGTNFTLIDTLGADVEAYTDTTATPGVTYWYRVQACTATETSDFSNTVETGVDFTEINYGILYNWWAASGNIAPAGWHLPTYAEATTLITYLGGNAVAGGKLKEIGLTYWQTPNTGATNEVSFNMRGSGLRNGVSGAFSSFGANAGLILNNDLGYAFNFILFSKDNAQAIEGASAIYTTGYSIRFMKDDAVDPGVLVDYDGNVYPTVTIGTQVWMAQNLIVKHYNDGTPIPEVTDNGDWVALGTGAWCYFNNDPDNM